MEKNKKIIPVSSPIIPSYLQNWNLLNVLSFSCALNGYSNFWLLRYLVSFFFTDFLQLPFCILSVFLQNAVSAVYKKAKGIHQGSAAKSEKSSIQPNSLCPDTQNQAVNLDAQMPSVASKNSNGQLCHIYIYQCIVVVSTFLSINASLLFLHSVIFSIN